MTQANINVCRVANIPFFFQCHLRDQVRSTVQGGYDVHLISSGGPGEEEIRKWDGVRFRPIPITRKISVWRDLRSLGLLYRYFRKHRIQIVHSVTPKAGLLCAIAAFLARIPVRMHNFSGQPWLEFSGFFRWVLKACDWTIVRLNTHCFSDSRSQTRLLVEHRICGPDQLKLLGEGSIAGVDLERFDPARWAPYRPAVREELKIHPQAKVLVCVGRLTEEKGIRELTQAFENLLSKGHDVFLILVGPIESERFPLTPEFLSRVKNHPRIRAVGFSDEPEKYLAASDIFCLPSYRESFGIAVIEAGAMGLPTVATRVVGLVDSVIDGETGVLVPPRDARALSEGISRLLLDEGLCSRMGEAAKKRVIEQFDAKRVNELLLHEYSRLIANA